MPWGETVNAIFSKLRGTSSPDRLGDIRVDFSDPDLIKVIEMVGGIDRLAKDYKSEESLTHKGVLLQAVDLAKKIEGEMGKDAATRAQDAFGGASRMLALRYLQKEGQTWRSEREADILNATNVIDTALDFASGRYPYPKSQRNP